MLHNNIEFEIEWSETIRIKTPNNYRCMYLIYPFLLKYDREGGGDNLTFKTPVSFALAEMARKYKRKSVYYLTYCSFYWSRRVVSGSGQFSNRGRRGTYYIFLHEKTFSAAGKHFVGSVYKIAYISSFTCIWFNDRTRWNYRQIYITDRF